MKYITIVQAYTALRKLLHLDFNVKDAYSIFKLYKQLDCIIQFGIQRENDLIKKYNGVIRANRVEFVHGEDEESIQAGIENMQKFKNELEALNSMEVSETINQVVISYESLGDQKISPNDIISLDGFVTFE